MAVLWRSGPLPFALLIEEVQAVHPWGGATIKTLLHRLMQKGAVASVKEDGRQRYHARLSREAYLKGEVAALVDRLFDGDPSALAAFIADWPKN